MSKTKTEIIKETVAFYEADPKGRRAWDAKAGSCLYLTDDGRKCAVGRCLTDEWAEKLKESRMTIDGLAGLPLDVEDFQTVFKEEYRGHDANFWGDLQYWHDNSTHWNTSKNPRAHREAYTNLLLEKYEGR